MRRNGFGDTYCHTLDEARRIIDNSENGWKVYAGEFSLPVPESTNPAERVATCEIRENQSGDLVCYLEAPTMAEVEAMVADLKIKEGWG